MTIAEAVNLTTLTPAPVVKGGILAVADVIDNPDPHSLLGVEFDSDACLIGGELWATICTVEGVTGVKDFTGPSDTITGTPFIIYAGVECNLTPMDEVEEKAAARLRYSERRLVDEAVYTRLAATDVASGVAGVPVEQAVAALEALGAITYGGVSTLVVPVEAVTLATGKGVIRGDANGDLTTHQGTRVANVAVARADPATLYVVGRITLIRGPIMTFQAPPMTDGEGDLYPARALAERIYVPLIECTPYSATADLTPA